MIRILMSKKQLWFTSVEISFYKDEKFHKGLLLEKVYNVEYIYSSNPSLHWNLLTEKKLK